MKLRTLTAMHAFLWIKNAFKTLKKKPGFFVKSAILYFLIASITSIFDGMLPPILELFPAMLISVYFTAAIMLGSNIIFNANEQEVHLETSLISRTWGVALKSKNIFILAFVTAIVYSVLYYGAYMVFGSIFGETATFVQLLEHPPTPAEPLSAIFSRFANAQAIELTMLAPTIILFSMTPALVLWQQTPSVKAIFYNVYACLKNWKTWLCWCLIEAIFSIGIFNATVLSYAAETANAQGTLSPAFTLILVIAFLIFLFTATCLLTIGYYFAYKDSFTESQQNNALNDKQEQSNSFDTF